MDSLAHKNYKTYGHHGCPKILRLNLFYAHCRDEASIGLERGFYFLVKTIRGASIREGASIATHTVVEIITFSRHNFA